MECFWSIKVLLSIHSVFPPAARWPVPGNARHGAPAKMVASAGAKGSAPVPLDGWYVLKSDPERTLTFMLPAEAARLWISSCVSRFPAGSEIWTSCLFFFTLTYLQAHFEATCHFWKRADGFPWMWQIDDEVSLFLECDSWDKSVFLIPSESKATDYFLHRRSVVSQSRFSSNASAFTWRFFLFPLLLCRGQSAQSDVQRDGLDQTVLRSVSATTEANVTLKLDSASAPKVSLVTGVCVCRWFVVVH